MAANGQDNGRLSNPQKARLAAAITKRDMLTIGESFFGMTPETLTNLSEEHGTNIQAFNRDVLKTWSYKNSSNDQVKNLAKLLYQAAATEGISVNPDSVRKILGVSEEEDLGGGRDPTSKQTGPEETHQVKSSEPKTTTTAVVPTGNGKELTPKMMINLSDLLTEEAHLRKLALVGLELPEHNFKKHVNDNRQKTTEAAYNLIHEWMHSQRNRKAAYDTMVNAIESVKLPSLLEALQ